MIEHIEFSLKIIEISGAGLLLLGSLYFFIKKRLSRRRSSLEFNIDYDRKINEILRHIQTQCEASSVRLWEFHNGIITAAGRSFTKMSVMYEVVKAGSAPYMNRLQSIPTSVMIDQKYMLLKEQLAVVPDTDYITDIGTRIFVQEYGVKAIMIVVIQNTRTKEAEGFIGVTYDDVRDLEELTAYTTYLLRCADELAYLLEREESFFELLKKAARNVLTRN